MNAEIECRVCFGPFVDDNKKSWIIKNVVGEWHGFIRAENADATTDPRLWVGNLALWISRRKLGVVQPPWAYPGL